MSFFVCLHDDLTWNVPPVGSQANLNHKTFDAHLTNLDYIIRVFCLIVGFRATTRRVFIDADDPSNVQGSNFYYQTNCGSGRRRNRRKYSRCRYYCKVHLNGVLHRIATVTLAHVSNIPLRDDMCRWSFCTTRTKFEILRC